ncbi:MAG: hypothetical protein WCS72_14550 [Deltaproteobacteria bacterium]
MNNPTLRIALLIAAALPTLAFGQPAALPSAEAEALVRSLPKGAEFRSDGRTYRPVAGLRAAPRTASRNDGQSPLQQASPAATTDVVVEDKGPYVIYRDASAVSAAGASLVGTPRVTKGSVVVNVRTGQLGIADGLITAKLTDVGAAQALAAANGLTVEFVAGPIGYVYFKAPPSRDLAAAAAALAKDPRVKAAYPGVQESFGRPG